MACRHGASLQRIAPGTGQVLAAGTRRKNADQTSACYHGHEIMVMKRKTSPPVVRETVPGYATDREAGPTFSKQVSAGEFKARCLALMDDVRDSGGEYVITKRGEPVAKLVPVRMERRPLLGSMKGTVTTLGDIVSPLNEPWTALDGWDDES
jgi:prevent-host-death family protein